MAALDDARRIWGQAMRYWQGLSALMICAATAASAADPSCRSEIGMQQAARLVRQCRDVSPATHPPCNAANPCEMIKDEIARSCRMIDHDRIAPEWQLREPAWCADYLGNARSP